MNVRNKVISIVMSFIIIFGTVSNSFANDKERINNIKPLVIDGAIISAPMLATVAGLAVGTGIVLNDDNDLYDIGRMFYDYIKKHNELTWDVVQTTFLACTTFVGNKIKVDSNFLDIVKGFFDNSFTSAGSVSYYYSLPYYSERFTWDNINHYSGPIVSVSQLGDGTVSFSVGDLEFIPKNPYVYYAYHNGNRISSFTLDIDKTKLSSFKHFIVFGNLEGSIRFLSNDRKYAPYVSIPGFGVPSVPYNGGYTWDNVESKKENDSVALPIPGNLGSLVGQGSTDFWENTDGLVGGGSISLPGVDSPSIGVTDDVFVGNPSTDAPGVDNPGLDKPGIVFPPFGGGLDFTPITQSSFVDKFPFSLAKDIKNIVSVFDVAPKAPKFTVPIVSEELEIDLTQFNIWASIIRFFVLIGFMIALINITRKVIG